MKRARKPLIYAVIAVSFLALILDSQTAAKGAAEGIELCVRTVIPSLFPFFIISILLTVELAGSEFTLFRPLGRLCKLPRGTESILLTGLLGGYPIGAHSICTSFTSGKISKAVAQHMLGFCNNAGPAFIFGMVGPLFDNNYVALLLWLIHIGSAIMTGIILPRTAAHEVMTTASHSDSFGQVMIKSIQAMANVCGWVVIFRVILCFISHWILWVLPQHLQILLSGILELSNGCFELTSIDNDSVRFVYASVFLALGGICVLMQTTSAVSQAGLDLGRYIPGKLTQASLSVILAVPTANLIFPLEKRIPYTILLLPLSCLMLLKIFMIARKNNSSIPAFTSV